MTIRSSRMGTFGKALAPAAVALALAAGCGGSASAGRSGVSASASGTAGSNGASGGVHGSISREAVNRVEQVLATHLVRDVHVSGSTLVVDLRLPDSSLTQSLAKTACSRVRDSGVLSAGASLGVTHVRLVASDGSRLAAC